MVASELPAGIAVRPLAEADVPEAMALVAEAGWNQVAADWHVFIELGKATALTDAAGRVVATAAMLPHGPGCAWISMVLVTAAWRRRGLARWLLGHCVEVLSGEGRVALLDATPAGRQVYLGLGFRDVWGLTRLVRTPPSLRAKRSNPGTAGAGSGTLELLRRSAPRNDGVAGEQGIAVRPLGEADWPALAALDCAAFGSERTALLGHLAARLPDAALIAERGGRPAGFLLGRDGRVVRQFGPLVAEDEAAARALLVAALDAVPGPLAIDLANRHVALAAWLAAQGFAPERPLTRMVLGRDGAFDDPARYFAIAGPEFG
jgi:GNAT superfamily N-acetyltransferase